EGSGGAISLALLYDFDQGDSGAYAPNLPPAPYAGEPSISPGRGLSGVRGIAHFQHRTEAGANTFAVQGTMASDVMSVSDAQPASLETRLGSLRTDIGAWRASGPLTIGADATLLQDIQIASAAYPDRRLFGPERRTTPQRLPALFAQLAPVELGPLSFSGEASAVQFLRFAGPDPQEKDTGFSDTDRAAGAPLGIGNAARAPTL